jgi:MtrB/PioB family decaheme-associated outer membrane protein
MRLQHHKHATRALLLATQAALLVTTLASTSYAADKVAEDPAIAELVHPTNSFVIGLGNVSNKSAKFGEYNGLGDSGLYGIGSFKLQGGGAYDSDDATRWRIRGNDLGLETRDVAIDYRVQGKFKLKFGYGESLRNHSDSYQSPYQGLGTGNLSLPSTWLKPTVAQVSATAVNFRVLSPAVGPAPSLTNPAPSAAQLALGQSIRDADLPSFHAFKVKSKRTTYDAGFGYTLGRQWELTGSFRHEKKAGTKPISAISTKSTFESSLLLPDPIDTTTEQFNLGISYSAKRAFLQVAYYGSIFKNRIKAVTWQDPSNLAVFSTQGSAPDNQFHQLNMTGGYNLSPATKLVISGSYGRNTQNDSFLTDPQLPLGLPRSSFDGEVVSRSVNLKLTTRPFKRLNLSTGYKFDDRDNRSPVNTYVFYDINVPRAAAASTFNAALGLAAGALGNNINIYANRPHSKRVNQYNLDGDYLVAQGQVLAVGYQWQKNDRHCNGTWYQCEDAATTRENALRVEWRARLGATVSSKLGYSAARRTVNYNVNAWLALVPMANVVPGAPTVGATTSAYGYMQQAGLSGWGPIAGFPTTALAGNAAIFAPGNNIITSALYGSRNQLAENPLMRRFHLADRDRDKIRTSVDWQPTEALALYGGLDFNQDAYRRSPLGLQNSQGWALNLDSSYALNDATSINLFYSREAQRAAQTGWNYVANAAAAAGTIAGGCFATVAQKNLNNKIDPCNAWTANARDRTDTAGLTLRFKKLWHQKLAVSSSVVHMRARTDMAVVGGNYAVVPGTTNLVYIPATDLPTVTSESLQLEVIGQYALSPMASLRVVYGYERLTTTDYAFAATVPGTLTTVMPSFEQAPRYSQHVIGVSYLHSFR